MEVLINGIAYVPKAEVLPINDERLQSCLETLTEMRYFNESHKMKALAWNAINSLSPELAELDEDAAFHRVHGCDGD